MSANPACNPFRPCLLTRLRQPDRLLEAPDRRFYVLLLHVSCSQAYTADEMVAVVKACGCAVSGQYGVRCLADYLPDDGRKDDPAFFAHLERLEHALAGAYPYYLLARYVHLIARKIMGGWAHDAGDADARDA